MKNHHSKIVVTVLSCYRHKGYYNEGKVPYVTIGQGNGETKGLFCRALCNYRLTL